MNSFAQYEAALRRLNLSPTEHVLLVPLSEKILTHYHLRKPLARYPFSFSKKPPSTQQDSLGTPWGLHQIGAKIGHDEPPGTVFIGRQSTGYTYHNAPADQQHRNLVTTRILRLRGLEPGLNAGPGVDSWDRFIYFHGTNHPDQFPTNRSAGCLLLRDPDLLRLFHTLPTASHVYIQPLPA